MNARGGHYGPAKFEVSARLDFRLLEQHTRAPAQPYPTSGIPPVIGEPVHDQITITVPAPAGFTYDELGTEPPSLRIDIFLGMFADAWWLLSILLSVRPPWLKRLVGLPSISRS
jgi:hypothetical protein